MKACRDARKEDTAATKKQGNNKYPDEPSGFRGVFESAAKTGSDRAD